MTDSELLINEFNENGFFIIDDIYNAEEVNTLISIINNAPATGGTFRRTNDLFAIRQFLKEVPEISPSIFNYKLLGAINQLFGNTFFVTKSFILINHLNQIGLLPIIRI